MKALHGIQHSRTYERVTDVNVDVKMSMQRAKWTI